MTSVIKPTLIGITYLQHCNCIPYCVFSGSFKVKSPVLNPGSIRDPDTFYYVGIGMYCCVCITLLQVRIAVVHN